MTKQISTSQEISSALGVLADPHRLQILDLLIEGWHCSSAIVEKLNLSPNLVSHHLRVLREAGLVDIERDPADGRWAYNIPNVQQLTEIQFAVSNFLHPARMQPRASDCGPSDGALPYCPPDYLAIEKELNMPTSKAKIIFLCTGNSARSQMAEAFMKHYASDHFEVHSAGLEPKGLNPNTPRVMKESGIDVSNHRSKGVREFLGHINFGYVVTVCDHAEENCPTTFLSQGTHLHWGIEDPAAFEGSDEETLQKFRQARDQIETKVKEFIKQYTETPEVVDA